MSVLFIVGPKCVCRVACCPWLVMVSMPTGQRNRRADATLLHYAFRYGCGQRNKHYMYIRSGFGHVKSFSAKMIGLPSPNCYTVILNVLFKYSV